MRSSFARQAAMRTLGVTLERVAPGEVDLALPFRADLTQQHGFLYAGIVTAVVDSAYRDHDDGARPPGAGRLTRHEGAARRARRDHAETASR